MKIYKPTTDLVRIRATREGDKATSLTVQESTMEEVSNFVSNVFKSFPYQPTDICLRRTKIEVREYKDQVNGKSKSFYLYGISPEVIKDSLVEILNNQ